MRQWNQKVEGKVQSWHTYVDGIRFVSYISYEDLMRQVREYLESR